MFIQLIQYRRRQVTRLRLWRLRALFVVDHALWSDSKPSLPMRHLKKVAKIEYVVLRRSHADSAVEMTDIFEQQSACDRPARHLRSLGREELREVCERL